MGGGACGAAGAVTAREMCTRPVSCVCVCVHALRVRVWACLRVYTCVQRVHVVCIHVLVCVCTCVLHVCGALRTCVHTPCARVCARVPCVRARVPCVREHLCVRCPRRPPGTVPQPQSRVGGVGAVSASGSVLGCRWARSSWSGNSLESPGTHRVTHLGPPHSAAAASEFPGARPGRPRCDPGCSEAEARPRSADGAPERGGLAADRDGAGARPALRASLRVRVPCPCGPAVSGTACDLRVAFVHGDDMQRDSRVARSARPGPGAPLAITATAFL